AEIAGGHLQACGDLVECSLAHFSLSSALRCCPDFSPRGCLGAAGAVLTACHKTQADALNIQSLADCRLADEYDAAYARGELRTCSAIEHITALSLAAASTSEPARPLPKKISTKRPSSNREMVALKRCGPQVNLSPDQTPRSRRYCARSR